MSYKDLLKGRHSSGGQEYFVTATTHGRTAWFAEPRAAMVCSRALYRLSTEHKAQLLCWVLMPDHCHLLLQLAEQTSLAKTMQIIKGNTALAVNKSLNRRGQLWQKGYYDHALRQEEDRLGIARYIVANPLRAGLVKRVGDYPYWDCVWL